MESIPRSLEAAASSAIAASLFVSYGFAVGWFCRSFGMKSCPIKRCGDRLILEVTLSDVKSAKEACDGGANSVELCADLGAGGITPSIGVIEIVAKAVQPTAQVHVLIRPRAGDFCYSDEEFEIILRDIIAAKEAGADGVVVGILTSGGCVDKPRMGVIRRVSDGMELTFHRAFDTVSDHFAALEDVISIGCTRLLTSGCAQTAVEDQVTLRELVDRSNGRISIVAAGGISYENVAHVITSTGVQGVHTGTAVAEIISSDSSTSSEIKMGRSQHGSVHSYVGVSAARVRGFVSAATQHKHDRMTLTTQF